MTMWKGTAFSLLSKGINILDSVIGGAFGCELCVGCCTTLNSLVSITQQPTDQSFRQLVIPPSKQVNLTAYNSQRTTHNGFKLESSTLTPFERRGECRGLYAHVAQTFSF